MLKCIVLCFAKCYKINLLRVIIRLFNQFVPGRLELRPRAPALQRLLEHDRLDVGLDYPDIFQVPPVVLCYHSVPCHHIGYDPRSAPVFLPKLIYNCTFASSLFPPLIVDPDL
ncbi:hypothetical protein PAEPH01_2335 [Pancytospora epiphaga]|nr:hypothetical protein PAEPH01_2335 [Pancytospora epiphaga]